MALMAMIADRILQGPGPPGRNGISGSPPDRQAGARYGPHLSMVRYQIRAAPRNQGSPS